MKKVILIICAFVIATAFSITFLKKADCGVNCNSQKCYNDFTCGWKCECITWNYGQGICVPK